MVDFDESITDAVTEIMNMAVGSASELLSDMINEEILLDVPKTEICDFSAIYKKIQIVEEDRLVAIHERFSGSFGGDAFLIFPQRKSLDLAAAALGMDTMEGDISEVAREALMEIGNIILNSCLGTICNLLNYEVDTEIPQVEIWAGDQKHESNKKGAFVHINFQMARTGTTGYLVIFMSQDAMGVLLEGIQQFISSYD